MANFISNQSPSIDLSRLHSTLRDEKGELFPMDDKFVKGVKLAEKQKSYDEVPELKHMSSVRNSTDDAARGEAIYEAFVKLGVKADDFFVADRVNSAQPIALGKQHKVKLGRTGDALLTTTSLITGVMEAVTPFVQKQIFDLFPEMSYGAWRLLIDKIDQIQGMLGDAPLGAPVPLIKKRGFKTYAVELPQIGNVAVFSQEDVLSLRSPGSNDLALRGLAQMLSYISRQLEHMGVVRRMNDIYSALINNQVVWQGKTYSMGIPGANYIHAHDMGGIWGSISATGVTTSDTANPIAQLANFLNFILTKERGLKIALMMNHKTNQLFCQNANVISRVSTMYANATMTSPDSTGGANTIDKALKYYLGGDLNTNVIIDASQYIAGPNDPNSYVDGTVNTLLPNGKIYAFVDTEKFGGSIGEYAYTLAVQNGGNMNPRPGKYFYMQDTSLTQTAEGIQQPQLVLGHGWNGGLRLFYPEQVYVFDVTTP